MPGAVCSSGDFAHLAKTSDLASVHGHAPAKLARVNAAFAQPSTERELVAQCSLKQRPSTVSPSIPPLAPTERGSSLEVLEAETA